MQEPEIVYLFDLLSLTGSIQENTPTKGIENWKMRREEALYAHRRGCIRLQDDIDPVRLPQHL